MNWKALTLVLLIPLAACQTLGTAISAYNYLTGVKITQAQMDVAVAAYDVAVLTPFNTYRYADAKFTTPRRYCTASQPFTLQNPCASYKVLSKLQPYIAKAEAARASLQNCINVQCSGMSALVAAFKTAWSAAQSTVKAQAELQGAVQ